MIRVGTIIAYYDDQLKENVFGIIIDTDLDIRGYKIRLTKIFRECLPYDFRSIHHLEWWIPEDIINYKGENCD